MTLKIKIFRIIVLSALVFAGFPGAKAESCAEDSVVADVKAKSRPVTGSYRVEIGRRSAYSNYLSPFSYKGTGVALSGFWTKVLPSNPEHLAMHFEGRLSYGNLLNPAGSARELDLHANVQWGLMWQKRFNGGWLFGAGGNIGVYGGALYLMRNGNNPVDAQFALGVGACAFASKILYIKRLALLISDRVNLPLAGGFFCQEYGEPYYEIYLGNRHGLAHFGWPGNRPGIDNLLCVTLDLGRTALEVGYRFSIQSEHANNLTTRIVNQAFVIGVIPGSIGLKSGKKNIISPLY